jgi:hypothetical protein
MKTQNQNIGQKANAHGSAGQLDTGSSKLPPMLRVGCGKIEANKLAEVVLSIPRIRTGSIRALALVCEAFQAEVVRVEPAAPRQYDPPTPDEYEQALCEA